MIKNTLLDFELNSKKDIINTVNRLGFLPYFKNKISGFSIEEHIAPRLWFGEDEGVWEWKGPIITESDCVYGKFFAGKAGFISREWWPDFCNYRRHQHPAPSEGSIEEAILFTLQEQGPLITRELRAACGFNGPKMRSRFDSYVTRLQMACRIITEDFVYPTDKHGREYGWGWSLLTTPEQLHGLTSFECPHTPEESFDRILAHFKSLLPHASEEQILKLIK